MNSHVAQYEDVKTVCVLIYNHRITIKDHLHNRHCRMASEKFAAAATVTIDSNVAVNLIVLRQRVNIHG